MTDNPALSHLIHNKSTNYTNTTHFIEPFHIITAFILQIYKQIHHFQPPLNYYLTLFNPQQPTNLPMDRRLTYGVRVSAPSHRPKLPMDRGLSLLALTSVRKDGSRSEMNNRVVERSETSGQQSAYTNIRPEDGSRSDHNNRLFLNCRRGKAKRL